MKNEVCSEILKTLIKELNRPGSAYLSEKRLRKKNYIIASIIALAKLK